MTSTEGADQRAPKRGVESVLEAPQQHRALEHLRDRDPVLRRIIDARPGFDPRAWMAELPPMDAFGALIFQVIGQQLSVPATRRILGRMQALFGGALPTPGELLAVTPETLRDTGLSGRKVSTLRALATEFGEDRLNDAKLEALSDREIEDLLTAIPGVGPWTVHGFLIIALDRDDVVLPGDLALRKAIQRCYGLGHLPSQAEVIQIAEAWRPHRSLATAYLFEAFEGPPETVAGAPLTLSPRSSRPLCDHELDEGARTP